MKILFFSAHLIFLINLFKLLTLPYLFTADWSCCPPNDPQGQVHSTGHPATKRLVIIKISPKRLIILKLALNLIFKSHWFTSPGVLLYGPPGTGKTLLARACAAQTKSTFLKLAGPQLVQMFIGDGAKLVRDAFSLAKEKAPAIIFIDELDAIGTKRFDSEKAGDREVQRTMLELLNQLDGFQSNHDIKVCRVHATTRNIHILSFLFPPDHVCLSRSLQPQTGLISLIRLYWDPAGWIGRSNSQLQTRKPERGSCRSTRGRWTSSKSILLIALWRTTNVFF